MLTLAILIGVVVLAMVPLAIRRRIRVQRDIREGLEQRYIREGLSPGAAGVKAKELKLPGEPGA